MKRPWLTDLLLFAFLLLLLAQALRVQDDVTDTDDLRAGCGRTNVRNESELKQRENLLENAQGRVQASNSTEEREASRQARYRANARIDELVESVAPVAVSEGSVEQDCNQIYGYPWPINWVRD